MRSALRLVFPGASCLFCLLTSLQAQGAHAAVPPPAAPSMAPPTQSGGAAGEQRRVDDRGRPYEIVRIAKNPALYYRVDESHIRSRINVTYELIEETADTYVVRVYEHLRQTSAVVPDPTATPLVPAVIPAPPPALPPASDGLIFDDFGAGLPAGGQWRNGFAVADVNGDGWPDIVHGPPRKSLGVPFVFLGDGKGNWKPWQAVSLPEAPYDYGDVLAADLNRDGVQDLVFGFHLRGLFAVIGDGKGRFSPWSTGIDLERPGRAAHRQAFSSTALLGLDWNDDGRLDVIALGEGPRLGPPGGGATRPDASTRTTGLVAYLNQGDGTWQVHRVAALESLFGTSIASGDFDGDQVADIAVGANVFAASELVLLRRTSDRPSSRQVPVASDAYPWSVAAGDFDGNGRDDLAVGYSRRVDGTWESGVDVILSRPDGTWKGTEIASVPSRGGVTALGSGDLDRDGKIDLVAGTGEGGIWVFRGDAQGAFTRERAAELAQAGNGCRCYRIQLSDLDRDGGADIVATFAGEGGDRDAPDSCPAGGSIRSWRAKTRGTP
ncbi:MAG: VCBS repeat-containing protein [Candidatus Schekmanbacteria bacterium]|nr:VCBS repeat-containing protein [Candidatus Schekmanbacteria bacterium]